MKYSKYANEWLVEFHKEWSHIDNHEIEIAGMLIDSRYEKYMKPVWNVIYKRECNKILAGRRFYSDCINAFNWFAYERQTPMEKKKLLLAISNKSRELIDLIDKNSLASGISQSSISAALSQCCNSEWDKKGPISWGFPDIRTMLARYAEDLDAESQIPPETAKPNASTAHEVVFVRRLTASMRNRFGQPLRTVVANTACVIFDTGDIDEKFVRDNTRD